MLWHAMRAAALQRHLMWNAWFEGGDHTLRAMHIDLVRRFYGY